MNLAEALAIVGVVRAGAIPQEMTDDRATELASYLLPLPYDYCRRAAERWAISVPLDAHGQPVPKFVSEPAAVLTGCGVPYGTRHLVDRALREGGEVYPSVRGAISDGGWEYVAPGLPLPRGVGEWYANAGLPLPAGRAVEAGLVPVAARPALPPGEPITEEQRRANLARLAGLARGLGSAKTVGATAALPRRTPAPAVDPAVIEAELQAFEARHRAVTERSDAS